MSCEVLNLNHKTTSTNNTNSLALATSREGGNMGLGPGLADRDMGFEKVTKVKSLVPVLYERLPKSCNVLNMAQIQHRFQDEMSFYVFYSNHNDQQKREDHPWILATYSREDYGIDINISAPSDLSQSYEFGQTLINSDIVPWEEDFIFAAIDSNIVPLIQNVIMEVTRKNPVSFKNLMFYAPRHYHSPLTHTLDPSLQLKPLDAQLGSKFLINNWPFAKSGSLSYVHKLIQRNCSAGVYVNGKLVSGAAVNGSGMITMLHTVKEHRRRGFGQLCMKYLIRLLAKEDLIPCCTVELTNTVSIALQQKIGLLVSNEVSYINKSS